MNEFFRTLIQKRHLSSVQIIVFGFLSVILAGSMLLMLPAAVQSKEAAPFQDALFTAASAVCVTGLTIHDTASYWSIFGQIVIILLIQIGGMGVMTAAISIAAITGKRISLMQRSTMQEAISAPQLGEISGLTTFIFKTVIAVELIGAAVMAPVFCRDFGLGKGLWYALFHSISAFCNAGFDLMGAKTPYSSLTCYSDEPAVILTAGVLIIIGGIGFLTWNDIKTYRLNFKSYRMQSKVIIAVTCMLILLPALYFFFIEFPSWNMPAKERILASLFQAVTPRTAGFNSIELSKLSEPGQALITALMLIGGSPGSTAGGIKTTTIAVLLFTAAAVFRKKEDAGCFGRRITSDTVKYAAAISTVYIMLFFLGGSLISSIEKLPILTCLFETASAIGTVGLSLGITPTLSTASRYILITLMFFGRAGAITLILAILPETYTNGAKLPEEKLAVG